MKTLTVIGLGYIGLPTAVVFASRSFSVIGVDVDVDRVEAMDVLLVFNELMASYTSKYYGVHRDKFVLFELLDYGADIKVSAQNRAFPMDDKSWVIAYAANFSDPKVRKTVKEFIIRCYEEGYGKVKLILVGKESSMLLNTVTPNVIVFDEMSPEKLEEKVYSQSHFGLVLKMNQYYEFGSTSKFSSYLHAGLPVVVPEEYIYLSKLVKKYEVGIVFKDCRDLINKLKVLAQEEYIKISISAKRLGIKIRQGYFFKKALFQALKLLYQRGRSNVMKVLSVVGARPNYVKLAAVYELFPKFF
jgi:hypothetical protein